MSSENEGCKTVFVTVVIIAVLIFAASVGVSGASKAFERASGFVYFCVILGFIGLIITISKK